MALGSTQPLTEMSTRNISLCVKAAGEWGWQHSCADCLEIWDPQRPGTLEACSGLYRDSFNFTIQNDSAANVLFTYTCTSIVRLTLYVRTGKHCSSNLNTLTAERENIVPAI
jgi:hypothetical protein